MRLALLFASIPLALAIASPARAADPAAAQALFEQGKQLLAQNRVDDACRAFDESQKLDPGIGTLFHLAECEEQRGRTATAWADFLEVSSEARAKGEIKRADAARERADALEPKLARLAIDPGADRSVNGLQVVRDGVVVGAGSWAVAVPVDPGEHAVAASAPGHGTWQTKVRVAPGANQTVTVPLLPTLGEAPPAEAKADDGHASTTTTTSAEMDRPTTGRGNGQRAVGIALGAAGIVGAGVGTYFGLLSRTKHDDSSAHCAGNACDPQGVALRDDAVRAGNASTIAFVAGGALLVGGVITFFTAPHDAVPSPGETAHAGGSPRIAISPAGVSLHGTF